MVAVWGCVCGHVLGTAVDGMGMSFGDRQSQSIRPSKAAVPGKVSLVDETFASCVKNLLPQSENTVFTVQEQYKCLY